MRVEQGVAWVDLPDNTFRTATPGECAKRITELEAALRGAQRALSSSHEVAVRKAVNTWWEPLEKELREAHDQVTRVLGETAI